MADYGNRSVTVSMSQLAPLPIPHTIRYNLSNSLVPEVL